MVKINQERLNGVWSATPTPFTDSMKIDTVAVRRMVEHHLRLGVKGLFLGGTCGEGAWMTNEQRRTLVRTTAKYSDGRLLLAVQVTDNSAPRILDNIQMAKEEGADIAVIAPPYFHANPTPENIAGVYIDAIQKSSLPIGIYDRGVNSQVPVPNEILKNIYAEQKVILVKDSSCDPEHMKIALDARQSRPELRLLNGYEWDCVTYLKAGYDGLLLGGGIFNGHLAAMIIDAVKTGNIAEAERLQNRMNQLMWDVYGGKQITCWLTGLKQFLVEMKIFRTNKGYLNYPLTASCKKTIAAALEREADILLP